MALAPFPRTPQPTPRPTYPRPGGGGYGNPQSLFTMMQIMMKMAQMMMTQFQHGGNQYGSPFQTPGGYGSPQPSPFNYGVQPHFYA